MESFFLNERIEGVIPDKSQCYVREFIKDDIINVIKVFNEASKATVKGLKKSGSTTAKADSWTEKDILNRNNKNGKKIFIYMNDDEFIGACGVAENKERKGRFYIGSFGILKEFRRRGFGEDFMKKMLEYLKEKMDCKEVWLNVAVENKPAKNLYTKLGYKTYTQEMVIQL